jgi:hypothetical protein
MDITGKIIAVLPSRGGTSARTGSEWKSQEYVIETHDQYPKKCCFDVFGADKIASFNIQSGEELTVSFDVDAHEYNGRWFNSIRAWKVERVSAQAVAPSSEQISGTSMNTTPFPPSNEAPTPDSADDLPF